MNPKNLNVYKVTFDDGTVKNVYGVYAAHGWSIAQQLFPAKVVKSLELLKSHTDTNETQHTAV